MARWYHEPDPFRYHLGALIQAARSTTFMLQKEKDIFEDFSWYDEWTERAKDDPVLPWLVSARTDLVHRTALEPHSWLEVHCIGNPRNPHGSDENPLVMQANPFSCTHYYMSMPPGLQVDHPHEYVRHWGIDGLPDFELLDACAHAYDRLDDLVTLAHHKLNAQVQDYRTPDSKRNLPCMENPMHHRVVRTVLKDGREVWIDEPPGLHEHA